MIKGKDDSKRLEILGSSRWCEFHIVSGWLDIVFTFGFSIETKETWPWKADILVWISWEEERLRRWVHPNLWDAGVWNLNELSGYGDIDDDCYGQSNIMHWINMKSPQKAPRGIQKGLDSESQSKFSFPLNRCHLILDLEAPELVCFPYFPPSHWSYS